MGKLIILNRKGDETITKDVRREALRMIAAGYMMYAFKETPQGGIELAQRVPAEQITDNSQLAALMQTAGG